MGDKTKIQWTDASWNPIRAASRGGKPGWFCEHASAGCANCYAESMNHRLGTGVAFKPGHRLNGDVESFLDWEMLTQPLRWARPRMIFPCSMTDIFLASHPDEWVFRMLAVMAATPRHTYQVLTKRARRMAEFLSRPPEELERGIRAAAAEIGSRGGKGGVRMRESFPVILPLPNVWWGTSVEDLEAWRTRWPSLAETPAAIRFVSFEPLLGHVDICEEFGLWWNTIENRWCDTPFADTRDLDWAIIGGESGPKARRCELEWIESLVAQLAAAGVPTFVKQLGAVVSKRVGTTIAMVPLRDPKGGDPAEWPGELRVREMPPL